jgi:hypothetical protein
VFETQTVNLLWKAVTKTLPTLGPHLGLFLAVYYGFAGMGIAFFCGKIMQHPCEGGPGFWGQEYTSPDYDYTTNPGYSPFSGTCEFGYAKGSEELLGNTLIGWPDTAFAGGPFYYNLNFNGFPNAIATLYVLTIGNNWTQVANGPTEVMNFKFHWFFFTFSIVNNMVMLNVLVGVIIDALDSVRQADQSALEGEVDPLLDLVSKRLECTKAPSGQYYSATWQVTEIPLHGPVREDAKNCPQLYRGDNPELEDEVIELNHKIKFKKWQIRQAKDGIPPEEFTVKENPLSEPMPEAASEPIPGDPAKPPVIDGLVVNI